MKLKKVIITLAILAFIPAVAIFVLYRIAMATDLPGRRGGPQDAFRHTFSTALTARYLSPKVVEFVTWATERDHSSPYDRMDIHNNRIGTNVGLGEGPLYETVMKKVLKGQIDAHDIDVITWMPEKDWDMGL